MAKPIINSLKAMSCADKNVISFTWSGNTISSSTMIIQTQDMAHEYVVTSTNPKPECILDENLIDVTKYGTQYMIKVKVVDTDGNESPWSDSVFAMFITPSKIKITNLVENQKITISNLEVEASYFQDEGERLKEYEFILYDGNGQRISSSEINHDVADIKHTFYGLNNDNYSVQVVGSTVNGYIVESEKVGVIIEFIRPTLFSTLVLKNHEREGYITYYTNIIIIRYNGDEEFEYEDGKIVLDDKVLYYDQGFEIKTDGTFIIKGDHMYRDDVKFFEIKNEDGEGFYITAYIYDDETIRYKLVSSNALENYVLHSKPIPKLNPTDEVTFWCQRRNDVYAFATCITYEGGREQWY